MYLLVHYFSLFNYATTIHSTPNTSSSALPSYFTYAHSALYQFFDVFFLSFTTICAVQTPNLVTLWTSISRVLLILSNQSQRK